ncbi:hypothetical protein GQ44DRAFT_711526 [Phaeosphaeriaceae sp. PMI808]|nr:hypothetical protein GQ44DRAFT_711526 [Phaeosphaeriaceae sp. PMI808]
MVPAHLKMKFRLARGNGQGQVTTPNDGLVIPTTILSLPPELILSISDFLPQDDRACLALTCHQMLRSQGTRVLAELDNHRAEKAAFLQKLQNAKPDVNLWLCYSCIRFHSTHQHRRDPTNFLSGTHTVTGFPYCNSTYSTVLDEVRRRLDTPRHQWPSQETWIEDDITTPNRLSVYFTMRASSTHLYLRRRHILHFRSGPWHKYDWNVSIYELLEWLETANIDICPHVCINGSWRKGDNSIMDQLNKYHKESVWKHGGDFTGYSCAECRLEVEVQCTEVASQVVVVVWQEVGKLGCVGSVVDESAEQKDQLLDQALKMKGPKKSAGNLEMGSKNVGQTMRKLLSPSSQKWLIQKTLNILLRSMGLKSALGENGSWTKQSGFGKEQKQKQGDLPVPASVQPVDLQLATEMKMQWEALENEAKIQRRLGLGCDGNEVVGMPNGVD